MYFRAPHATRPAIAVLLLVAIAAPAPAADWQWIVAGEAADGFTTWWAIHEGALEGNPLMRNHWVAVLVKSGYTGFAWWACHEIREAGHPEAARWIARGIFVLGMILSGWAIMAARRARALQ